jgi:hypothetical protein
MDQRLEQLAAAYKVAVHDAQEAKNKYEACLAMCDTAKSVQTHAVNDVSAAHEALIEYLNGHA